MIVRRFTATKEVVVIIYCNIFLPLLLTALSVNLVVLLTLSCDCPPPPHALATICQYGYPRNSPLSMQVDKYLYKYKNVSQ